MAFSKNWTKIEPGDDGTNNGAHLPQRKRSSEEPPRLDQVEMFLVDTPRRNLQDLVVSEVTLQQIRTLLAKIQFHETLYVEWNLQSVDLYGKRIAINLYGPPGTGKTFCADAIAAALGKSIIRVNYAELESKYVGETSKNIRAAFAKARQADAVLFFDEAESILEHRLTQVTQSSDHSVNLSRSVMLLELDQFEGVTIFASNFPGNYDGAFVRRILGHVHMPLPDTACRQRLWTQLMPREVPGSEQLDKIYLAEHSEGLSGGDILNTIVLAATAAVQRKDSHKFVTQDDVMHAIAAVRKASQEIGKQADKLRYMTVTDTPPENPQLDIQE